MKAAVNCPAICRTHVIDFVTLSATPPENHALRARIDELETIVHDYEVLLEALPDLFERKFQQRLEPLMERYRLLARAQQLLGEADLPLIEQRERQASENRLPLLERWRQARNRGQGRSTRNAA